MLAVTTKKETSGWDGSKVAAHKRKPTSTKYGDPAAGTRATQCYGIYLAVCTERWRICVGTFLHPDER